MLTVPGRPEVPRHKSLPISLLSGRLAAALLLAAAAGSVAEEKSPPTSIRRISRGGAGPVIAPFDLQARIGKGKPVALIFWVPGYHLSERFLVRMSGDLRREWPAYEIFAVAGRSGSRREEEILESATMLGVEADVPLLIDDAFALSLKLKALDVPNLAIFDPKGRLVTAKIKGLNQQLLLPAGLSPARKVLAEVAAGADLPEIKQAAPYYPATELYGACAPEFISPAFDTQAPYRFAGEAEPGVPTLLMFWSSTCGHCKREIPALVAWMKSHPGRLNVVSVTHIEPERPGRPSHRLITAAYLKEQEIPWPVLEDPDGAVMDLYRTITTPTSFFVSPRGKIVDAWYYAHPTGFDEAMEQALARAKAADAAGACEPAPGEPEPRIAFDMLDPGGARVSLASKLGAPAIVHLWATWCAPCVEEIPALLRFGEKLEKSGDGRLLMISVEDAAAGEKITGFAEKLGLDLRSYRAPTGGLASALDLSYRLPRTYVVAPNGAVLATRQGSQKWDDPAVQAQILSRLHNAKALSR